MIGSTRGLPTEAWPRLFAADPRPWLLDSDEPAARWLALSGLLDEPVASPRRAEAHSAVLADAGTRELIERLPAWDYDTGASGHDRPEFIPNLLDLLADRGVTDGDDPRVEAVLEAMLLHQDLSGRFLAYGRLRSGPPAWSTLLCDTHAITGVLIRYGRGADPRVKASLTAMAGDLEATRQGIGWPCRPDALSGFRGPGRKTDLCPMVSLQALRALARVPAADRPLNPLPAARTLLSVWRGRGDDKPYMFGHGRSFKTVKWPPFWYGVWWMLDTLGRYPDLWTGPDAQDADRRSLAELAACLLAYNVRADGKSVPLSTYKGFETHSFGQKKRPSAWATAMVAVAVRRFDGLTDEIAGVDVLSLGSSKGGTGRPLPPKVSAPPLS